MGPQDLRTAAYEYERRIAELEADNADLRDLCRTLWLAQFSPPAKDVKKDVNARMRAHGIEVYP